MYMQDEVFHDWKSIRIKEEEEDWCKKFGKDDPDGKFGKDTELEFEAKLI
jgi:hypothetical protein